MFAFFDYIAQLIASLVSFVIQLVSGVFTLLSMIPSAVLTITTAIGALPSILSVFATVTVTLAVIFLLTGRNSGGEG